MSIEETTTVLQKLQHPYFMVVAGVILWHFFVWTNSKDSLIWWTKNYKSIIASLLLGFSVIVWDDEFIGMISDYDEDYKFQPYWYLLIGPATELVKGLVAWVRSFHPLKKHT